MYRERNPNLEILERVVHQLGPLADQMVFLGGCATGLLLTIVGPGLIDDGLFGTPEA